MPTVGMPAAQHEELARYRRLKLHLGTQGWSYPDWLGDMYDADLKPESYLRAYAEEFDSVEIDSTFYGTPAPERVAKWAAAVPPGFLFSCKIPREITHEARMAGTRGAIATFYDVLSGFGDRLGCVLFQFEQSFSRAGEPAFWEALDGVREGVTTAVEFRDPAWYDAGVQNRLAERGIALAVADAPFIPDDVLAATLERNVMDYAYVRWIGTHDAFQRFDAVQMSRQAEVTLWARRLKQAAPRLKRIFGYVNNHYQGHSPATVRALYDALGVPHVRPARIKQTNLFA